MNRTEKIAQHREIQTNGMLYEDGDERAKHLNTIQSLAAEMNQPVNDVADMYEDILLQYKLESTVQTFLSVLVSKKIRQIYQQQRSG